MINFKAKEKNDNKTNNNMIKSILIGNFWSPFIKLSLTQLFILLISIQIVPITFSILKLDSSKMLPFLGLFSFPLLFGTGSSIFLGSKLNEMLNNKSNLKKLILILTLGLLLFTSIFGSFVLFNKDNFGLNYFSNLNILFLITIIMLQNIFLSFNILFRVIGNLRIGVIFQAFNILGFLFILNFAPENYKSFSIILLNLLLLFFTILPLLSLLKNSKKYLNNNSNYKDKDNDNDNYNNNTKNYTKTKNISTIEMIKEIFICGIPTFMIQFFALIGSFIFISYIPNGIKDKYIFENIYSIYFSSLSFINLIIISIINASGIIFTILYFNTDKTNRKDNKLINDALKNSIIITIIISLFISLLVIIFKLDITKMFSNKNIDYNSNVLSFTSLHLTAYYVSYVFFALSLLIGGLYQAIKKPTASFVLSIFKLYILFIPINYYALVVNSTSLKLYSGILSDIIIIIITVACYLNLKKEIN